VLLACVETVDACHWVDGHGWNYYVLGLEDSKSLSDADVASRPAGAPAAPGDPGIDQDRRARSGGEARASRSSETYPAS
jgi:hypothetical protein